jgi:hypothetical protein
MSITRGDVDYCMQTLDKLTDKEKNYFLLLSSVLMDKMISAGGGFAEFIFDTGEEELRAVLSEEECEIFDNAIEKIGTFLPDK